MRHNAIIKNTSRDATFLTTHSWDGLGCLASKGKRPRGAGFRKDKTEVPPDQNIKLAFGAVIVVTRYPAFHQTREE
jgi:hypothetical protein